LPEVDHSAGDSTGVTVTPTKNIVEPYITMKSPGSRTSTLSASAHASIVPTATAVPSGSPVSAAASAVTCPATSLGHANSGSGSPGAIRFAHSGIQVLARRS
jgi:hypothetical protein